jgi:hypothetical protein
MRSMASRRMAAGTCPVILRGSQVLAPQDDATQFKERTNHLASIHKDIPIDAHPNDVWAAVRDFGAVHRRLVPGFVRDAQLDGEAHIVTFAKGNGARASGRLRRGATVAMAERVLRPTATATGVTGGASPAFPTIQGERRGR